MLATALSLLAAFLAGLALALFLNQPADLPETYPGRAGLALGGAPLRA